MRVLSIWAALVLTGFGYLMHYTATAGVGDRGVSVWPSDTSVARQGGRATLIVFMHPVCPCSRATVNELSKLLTHVANSVDAIAVFVRPPGFDAGWERAELWDNAARIPGVRCLVDPGGNEARRFGAATSGYSLLYDPKGALVFRGGITAARSHEGDNVGENAILSWVRDGKADVAETPAFGCPLFDE